MLFLQRFLQRIHLFTSKFTHCAHSQLYTFTRVALHKSQLKIILIYLTLGLTLFCMKQAVLRQLSSDWLSLMNRGFKQERGGASVPTAVNCPFYHSDITQNQNEKKMSGTWFLVQCEAGLLAHRDYLHIDIWTEALSHRHITPTRAARPWKSMPRNFRCTIFLCQW